LEIQVYKPSDGRIQRVLDSIDQALDRDFSVSELARQVGLSDSYFHRLFQVEMGVSPAKYSRDLKLRQAERLIKTTTLPVKDICSAVGVTDRSHFNRRFKQMYGLSPSLYRACKGIQQRPDRRIARASTTPTAGS
jgi:transcriptional regulator GlxA family with amidase domain